MSGLLPATCALKIAFYIPHTYCYQSFPAPKLKSNKSKALGPSIGGKENQFSPSPQFQSVQHKKKTRGPYPFIFSLASVSILQSSQLYAPAFPPLIRSYLSSFSMNYITFRTVEIGKPYLFKEK